MVESAYTECRKNVEELTAIKGEVERVKLERDKH